MSLQPNQQSKDIVKSFQEKIGVEADGIFGPKTYKAGRLFYNLTADQAANFFGQLYVETAGFSKFEEDLNYTSTTRLKQVFPWYFVRSGYDPKQYVNNPKKLANLVYGGRLGNVSGTNDGWRFRGRGAIQLTGKNNYTSFGKWLEKKQLLEKAENILWDPDIVFVFAFESAIYYFDTSVIWPLCIDTETETVRRVTRKIAGSFQAIDKRIAAVHKIRKYYDD